VPLFPAKAFSISSIIVGCQGCFIDNSGNLSSRKTTREFNKFADR
jgi:hypothetical protein